MTSHLRGRPHNTFMSCKVKLNYFFRKSAVEEKKILKKIKILKKGKPAWSSKSQTSLPSTGACFPLPTIYQPTSRFIAFPNGFSLRNSELQKAL